MKIRRAKLTDDKNNFELLARVSDAINSTLEPKQVLNLVLQEAVSCVRATSGSIMLTNPHTLRLEIEASIGLSEKAKRLTLAIGRGITGWVAKTGEPLRVDNVQLDPRYVLARRGISSELAVPLKVEGKLIGVLNVDSKQRNAFSASDEELLVALGNQAAKVIHHSWLYQAAEKNLGRLEALLSVAQTIISSLNLEDVLQRVTVQACKLLNTKVCSIMLVDSTVEMFELKACVGAGLAYMTRPPFKVRDSLIGVVVTRKKHIQVYNVQEHGAYRHIEIARKEGLVSLLSVPLVSGTNVIGALNVYTHEPYRFSNQDIKVLSALANLAAVSIENARLHEKIITVEEQIRRNERLSTLGLLATEVAHEIRNPLTVMKMLYHSLDLKFPVSDPRHRDVEIVAERMDHLNKIVNQLLGYARSNEPAFELLNLNCLIEEVLLLTRHKLAQHKIIVKKRYDKSLPDIRVDRGQVEQVCLNLILNASDAMSRGGTLTVATSSNGSYVSIEIKDTGVGIPLHKQKRLFEPFLTSKSKGTGLGLAIVQKIVEAHRGTIKVQSKPRDGTCFHIAFPHLVKH